jgi:hypothetical protein
MIESCGTDVECRAVKRINGSAAYFLSVEFQKTGMLAYLANKAAFGTTVLYGQFERDVQQLQLNFTVGAPGADAQLETNIQAFFADFVLRPPFLDRYPTTLTPAQFVDALIANMGFSPTDSERNAATAEFGAAGNTVDQAARARAVRRLAEIPTFAQREFNAVFVLMQYFGYLRRDPDTAGYNFWLNKLNAFNGDFVASEMVKAFITSLEYRQRFGPS